MLRTEDTMSSGDRAMMADERWQRDDWDQKMVTLLDYLTQRFVNSLLSMGTSVLKAFLPGSILNSEQTTNQVRKEYLKAKMMTVHRPNPRETYCKL